MPNAPSLVAHKFEQRGVVLHFDGDADQEPDPRFSEKFFIVKGSWNDCVKDISGCLTCCLKQLILHFVIYKN